LTDIHDITEALMKHRLVRDVNRWRCPFNTAACWAVPTKYHGNWFLSIIDLGEHIIECHGLKDQPDHPNVALIRQAAVFGAAEWAFNRDGDPKRRTAPREDRY
jgi:hypothetical protein